MAIAGYHNRVLEVDLSTGSIKVEPLQPQDALLYLGGRGLASKLLYDRIDPKTDPIGPGNIIVIATSPLVGSQEPTLWFRGCSFRLGRGIPDINVGCRSGAVVD